MSDTSAPVDNTSVSETSPSKPVEEKPLVDEKTSVEDDKSVEDEKSVEEPKEDQSSDDEFGMPDLVLQALTQISMGKRSLVIEDVRDAVEHFSHACQLLDSVYGSGSRECAEAYFLYGSSLLEVSRLDNGVVDNNKLPANEDEDDDEGDDGFDESAGDDNLDVSMNEEVEEEIATETAAQASEPQSSSSAAGPSHDPQPSTSKGEPSAPVKEEKEEDITDSELAWEMLNMARVIYSEAEQTSENIRMHAETLQKLGEISLEWENTENALDLLTLCLKIRKENNIHPRIIAQTYHFLALATASKNEFDKSVTYIKDAIILLEAYQKKTEELLENEIDNDKKEMHKMEINDIESLLPEILIQLEEYQAQEKTGYQSLSALEDEVDKNEKTNGRASDASGAADKPVNDISHLVKRKVELVTVNDGDNGEVNKTQTNGDSVEAKRKIDEVDENSDPKDATAKKPCIEEATSKPAEGSSEASEVAENSV